MAVANSTGYGVYNCSPFGQCYTSKEPSIGQVEMLFSTSLVVVVCQGETPAASPRKIKIVNTKRNATICELTFPTSVLKVRMNRERLIVVLEDQIYIYNIANMKLLQTLETAPNKYGVADLSSSGEITILAYPSGTPATHTLAANSKPVPSTEVTLYDCTNLAPLNVVRAHKSPLAVLKLSHDGSLLASASEKGTIVRVFAVPSGNLLYQFRRGTYPSRVFSISFNNSSTLLAISSSTSTVHIYRLKEAQGADSNSSMNSNSGELSPDTSSNSPPPSAAVEPAAPEKKKGYAASLRRKVDRAQKMLPTAVADMWESKARDFAWFKLPSGPSTVSVVAFPEHPNLVYIATSDGSFYHYTINLDKGGECTRAFEYSV